MPQLHRFWFSFKDLPPFSILGAGCGVTAYSHDDAVQILKDRVFQQSLPGYSLIADVDVSSLDEHHVRPNIGVVTQRGVWFPLGY